MSRKDQMPNQQTMARNPVFVLNQISDLLEHFAKCIDGDIRVIIDTGIPLPKIVVYVFEVRKKNIDKSPDPTQRSNRIIAAGIVDDRYGQPHVFGNEDSFRKFRDNMRRGNQIDIVCAQTLETNHLLRQPTGFMGFNRNGTTLLADLIVLAEYAPQVATDNENSPGAPGSRNRRLLAEMQFGMSNRDPGVHPAKTGSPGTPDDPASARTD
jgi:hypothetical protein